MQRKWDGAHTDLVKIMSYATKVQWLRSAVCCQQPDPPTHSCELGILRIQGQTIWTVATLAHPDPPHLTIAAVHTPLSIAVSSCPVSIIKDIKKMVITQ